MCRRHRRGLLRGLPDHGRRLPAVLPRRVHPHRQRESGVRGRDRAPLDGLEGTFGGPVVEGDNPLDEAGVFQPTSEVLPTGEFPQFASQGAAEYSTSGQNPYAPVEGTRYAGAPHQDSSYMRLSKTVDLSGASAAELAFQLSASTEGGYDHVIVEAHTVGQDNWTTLPESGGATTTIRPLSASRTASSSSCTRSSSTTSVVRAAPTTAPLVSGTRSPARPTAGRRSRTTSRRTPARRWRCRSPT